MTDIAAVVTEQRLPGRRQLGVAALYAGGVLIGLTLVAVPSSSAYLVGRHGLSDHQYGQLFIAQLIAAIAGALLSGPMIRRVRLKSIYSIALACFAVSQVALAGTELLASGAAPILLALSLATFGLGFGLGGGPLNGLVATAFPRRPETAITALHFCAGVGLMAGPLLTRSLESQELWMATPVSLTLLAITLFCMLSWSHCPEPARSSAAQTQDRRSAQGSTFARSHHFWTMMALAFAYALVEGSFSNWAVIYVASERSESRDVAAEALALFWGALTLGRLLVTLSLGRVNARYFWRAMPVLMIAAYVCVSVADSAGALRTGFALAGLACSAFFPLTVSIAAQPYPEHTSWIASMLTAALMLGVGTITYAIGALVDSTSIAALYRTLWVVPAVMLVLIRVGRNRVRGRV